MPSLRAFALLLFIILCLPSAAQAQGPSTGRRRVRAAAAGEHDVPGAKATLLPDGSAAAPADAPLAVQQAVWAANNLLDKPYKYGGGHAQDRGQRATTAPAPSRTRCYHAGLLKSPLDSGSFMRWGERGRGQWITVFTNRGHAFAVIAGLRLDTSSYGSRTAANRKVSRVAFERGPRWRPDASPGARLPRAPSARPLAPIQTGDGAAAERPRPRRDGTLAFRTWTIKEAAVPGMGGRMSVVIKAKINKLLDRAEDPAETLEYSYQKQMELLQNVKKGIADVVTSKKRLQLQQQKLEQQVVKLDTQARQALVAGPRGPRAHRARAQAVRADRAAVARPAGRRAGVAAGVADREGAEAALQDRAVPHQEGGHQGAVLGCRGAGEDLRGRQRRGRGDGRRRHGDAACAGQDREHARPRRRDGGARGGRRVRRQPRARLRRRTTSTASCTSSPRRARSTTTSRA